MPLGRMYEYLLHLPHPESGAVGSFLCSRGSVELTVPALPPGQAVHVIVAPLPGTYARLGFWDAFCPTIVPNTMAWICSYRGRYNLATNICPSIIRDGFNCSCVLTESQPCYASVVNLSPLNQYFSIVNEFLVVETPHDYDLVMEALARLTSSKLEELAAEAKTLLEKMSGVSPRPPIGGR